MKSLALVLLAAVLLMGCTQPAATPTPVPTAIATPVPTVIATPVPTVEATATPTPAPEFKESTLKDFTTECSGKYALSGFIKKDEVREGGNINQGGNLTKMWIAYDGAGAFVPLAGYPPTVKPKTIDASSSVEYNYYGVADPHPTSEFKCWLRIEKMADSTG
jgi:hypothetical protein